MDGFSRVGTLQVSPLSSPRRAWLPLDPEEGEMPQATEVMLGRNLSASLVKPFAQDIAMLSTGIWIASVPSHRFFAVADILSLCGEAAEIMGPSPGAALWKVTKELRAPPGLAPPPGIELPEFQEVEVVWPPGRSVEHPSRGFSVVLLGPTENSSALSTCKIVRYAGVSKFVLGSINVGPHHRAVVLKGEAPGWLLAARAPTAAVRARVLSCLTPV